MDYSFFQQANSYPSVYKVQLDHPNELQKLYSTVILPDVPVCKVESKLAEYVANYIEPTGWKAIWRATPRSSGLNFKFDFLVKVIDVIRSNFDAVIVVEQPLTIQLCDMSDDDTEKDEIIKLLKDRRIINVPITELYIINEYDDEKLFLNSAVVIENVRFFLKFIWRPWDTVANETQLNEIFVETRLESRLNLYFDVQNKLLNEAHTKRIKTILTEGWELRYQLDDISKKQEQNSIDSDENDEYELDELDMSEAIRLKVKLEDFDREMRMLEDPYLRPFSFYLKGDLNDEDEKVNEESSVNYLHVVAESFDLNSLQTIYSYYEDDKSCYSMDLKFYQSLKKAIRSAKNGDKISLLPGHYVYDVLPWIEKDLQIEGLTEDKKNVVIQSSSNTDVFIHCSNNLTLKNLTIKSFKDYQCLIMAHNGLLTLENCCLDNGDSEKSPLQALSKAQIKLNNSIVLNKKLHE